MSIEKSVIILEITREGDGPPIPIEHIVYASKDGQLLTHIAHLSRFAPFGFDQPTSKSSIPLTPDGRIYNRIITGNKVRAFLRLR